MSFHLFNSKKERIIAILDIGSSSIGVAIVSVKQDHLPKILFNIREEMIFQRTVSTKRFISSMTTTLENILSNLEKYKIMPPSELVCFLSSPWYQSVMKTVEISNEKPFIVTHSTIEDLIQKDIEKLHATTKENNKRQEDMVIVDTKNIQTKLNGYETDNPYNKLVSTLEASFYVALASNKTLSSIKNSILRVFNLNEITFHSFSLAAFVVIRDIFTDKNNFIFMDITGEVTDLSLVRNNVLVGRSSFPFGKNFIIRRMSSRLNISPEEAISLFGMAQTKKSSEKIKERIDDILAEAKIKWLDAFSESILEVANNNSIPNTIFFTADGNISEYFSKILESEDFEQDFLKNKTFDVRFLNINTLENFCEFKQSIINDKNPKDPFIIIEAIFVNRNKGFL